MAIYGCALACAVKSGRFCAKAFGGGINCRIDIGHEAVPVPTAVLGLCNICTKLLFFDFWLVFCMVCVDVFVTSAKTIFVNGTAPMRILDIVRFTLIAASLVLSVGTGHAGERPLKTAEIKPSVIYHNYCSVCHGDRGNGQSRARGSLNPPPRDFTAAGELARDTMINFVTNGKPGTAMVAWKTQLTEKEIEAVVDYIRQSFMVVVLDPRLQRGKALFAQNCAICHGERGQGATHPVGGPVMPRDLSSPQARAELSRERMLSSVTNGRPGTAMEPFAERLSPPDIEAVVDYVWAALMVPVSGEISGTRAYGGRSNDLLSASKPALQITTDMSLAMPNDLHPDVPQGERFYNANCATCHGVKGDGKGPRAYFINPKPRNFTSPNSRAILNRPFIYAAVSSGRLGSEMPAWSKVLTDQEIANVSEYVFRKFIRPGGTPAKK